MTVADKPPSKPQEKPKRVKKPVQAVVRAMSAEKPSKAEVLSARSKFSRPMFDAICAGIAKGETLSDILRRPDMPGRQTFLDWCDSDESMSGQYARARQAGFDVIAEDLVRISDTERLGQITTTDEKGGESITTKDMIEHRRLQIDARKWLLARWDPKRYGDKQLHVGGDGESPVLVEFYMPSNGRESKA